MYEGCLLCPLYPLLIQAIRSCMIKDKLRLNDNKTEFMIIGTRKQMAKVNIDGLGVGESI